MTKILKKELDTCQDCPFMEHDGYDSCSPASYDCNNDDAPHTVIISEFDWDSGNNPDRLSKKHKQIPIPDWCPLPNKRKTRKKK